jgi:hypothetical protein
VNSINFIQRFGRTPNLDVQFLTVVLDGVFAQALLLSP